MKCNKLLVLSALALAAQVFSGNALANDGFPSDAEASYDLPALETYADRHARLGTSEAWGVSRREVVAHDPFPFGGGYIDD